MKTILFLWHLWQEIKETAADFIQFISKPNWRKMLLKVAECLGVALAVSPAVFALPLWAAVVGVLIFAAVVVIEGKMLQAEKRELCEEQELSV